MMALFGLGLMFGGMAGVLVMCIITVGNYGDDD